MRNDKLSKERARRAARGLKEYCRLTHCGECVFHDGQDIRNSAGQFIQHKVCKLRAFSEVIPQCWEI